MSSPTRDNLGRIIKAHTNVTCRDCGCRIGLANTRFGSQALKAKNPRCGPCYLKWKILDRKARGVL